MELTISILIFMAVSFLMIGIYSWKSDKQQFINKRLDKMVHGPKEEGDEKSKLQGIDLNKILSSLGKNFTGLSFAKSLETQLDKADILLRVEEFIGLNIITALTGAILGLALSGSTNSILVGAIIGALLPGLFVYRQKLKRADMLSEEIGESLQGMSNSLRAGYSFQQAIDLISRETQGPLGKEYRRTLREINLGVTTDQALQNLITRVQNEDMELMISTVLIQRSIGGNLAEIFDKIADTIRQRTRMKGEVRVLTAQGRISSWIVGGMPVFLIVILQMLNPEYISVFFETTLGWILLGGAAIAEVIGFILIRKVTNIEF